MPRFAQVRTPTSMVLEVAGVDREADHVLRVRLIAPETDVLHREIETDGIAQLIFHTFE